MKSKSFFYKTFLCFSGFLLITNLIYTAPSSKQIHILKQSDGSFFLAKQWGDERTNGWETVFGYTVLYDKDIHNWVYADKDIDGKLIKTRYVVVRDSPPSEVKRSLRPTPPHQSFWCGGKAPGTDGGDEGLDDFLPSASYPKTGVVSVPVILIDFDDADTTYTDTDIHTVIFGDANDTGVRNYFEEVSYGAFTFFENATWDTYLVDWVPADNSHDDYGHSNGNDEAAKLVREAVINADAFLDYSLFDNNSDTYVDGVIVIHQGPGAEESGQDTDIWSHTWSLSAAGLTPPFLDNVTIDTYIIVPETLFNEGDTQIITIGVLCHEFGHLLGLPNLYDTTDVSYGIGNWGTMGHGFWNGSPPGSFPAHFCAWSKWFLGWVTPTPITGVGRPDTKTTIKAIENIDADTEVYQLLTNTGDVDWTPYGGGEGEYFLLENRQAVGFDAGLPDTGLLIWHIDETRANNNDVDHKLVDLEEADTTNYHLDYKTNQGDGGDPYPGTTNNTCFNSQSKPNSKLYSTQKSKVRVEDIELPDTSIFAYIFINKDPELSGALLEPDEGDTSTTFIWHVDYQDDDGDTPYDRYLIIDDGDTAETKTMDFESRTENNWTYVFYYYNLPVGKYTHYFYFDDGQGGTARLPAGTYPSPTVLGGEEEPQPPPVVPEEEEEKDMSAVQWHCFIATASYGTPMAQEVKILSTFRDEYLITSPLGRKFVNFYYEVSPPIASFISRHPLLKKCMRGILKPIVEITKICCCQHGSD